MTWHGSLLERQRRELQEGLEAAKHSTREMQTLLDRLPVLVVIHHEGKILWVNGTVLRTLGFEKLADLVNASLFDIVPPSWRAMIESRMHVDPARESIPDLTEDALLT